MLEITPFEKTDKLCHILHSQESPVNNWEYVKQTYEGKIDMEKITLIKNSEHSLNYQMVEGFYH
jgi:hypothetical protein